MINANNDILISIIVPVYNVEKYIKKTVKSILNQEYTNIEIILIDDGSQDSSGKILDEMASIDSRIAVFHNTNQGVSETRNFGINLAKGEYVMFIDGDDWVEPDYVSYFLSLVIENNCDIGIGKYHFSIINGNQSVSDNIMVVNSETVIEWIYLGYVFMAVWNKIYKREFLYKNSIRFNKEIWYGEGMLFNIKCLQYVDNVVVGERKTYHYIFNTSSAMRSFNLKNEYCGIRSLKLQKELWKRVNKNINNAYDYHLYCINDGILNGLIRCHMEKEYNEVYRKCISDLRKNVAVPLKTDISLKRKVYWLCVAINPIFMAKRDMKKYNKTVSSLGKS